VKKSTILLLCAGLVLILFRAPVDAQTDPENESPFEPFTFELIPGFNGNVFVNDLFSPQALSVATAATDLYGTFYYFTSERDKELAKIPYASWEDLENITYSFCIWVINTNGVKFPFAVGTLPLKSYPAGLMFDYANGGRLLLFIRTLAINEVTCDFLIEGSGESATPSAKQPKSITPVNEEAGDDAWDLTMLEECFIEKLSILQMSGPFDILPVWPTPHVQ